MVYQVAGSRTIIGFFPQEGLITGRLNVTTRMKRLGIMALYPKPITSKLVPGH